MDGARNMENENYEMLVDGSTANIQAIDEEDEEVVVQGSVLQQVFSSFRDDFEVFAQPTVEVTARSASEAKAQEKRIDRQLLELVKMLCTSNLMLEEDANVLYSEDLEELEEDIFLFNRLGNIIMLLGEKVWQFLSTGILVAFGFSASHAIELNLWSSFFENDCAKLKKSFSKLIAEMKGTCDSVKKGNFMIRVGFATLNSKTVEQQFKLSRYQIQNHYYHRLENDLSLYTKSYCGFVIQTVGILIMATKRIIGSTPHPDYYVATKLEDRLRLLNDSDNLSLSKVNELFNIFIITQSEYLRALGLFLTTREIQFGSLYTDITSLVNAISSLRESSTARLSRGIYSHSYEEKHIPSMKQEETALDNLDSALTLLLTETFALKDYLRERGSASELDVNALFSNMARVKTAVEESSSALQRICNLVSKSTKDDAAALDLLNVRDRSEDDTNIAKSDVEVSNNDCKMAVGDRIYMCVIDEDANDDDIKSSDTFHDDEPPVFPAPLMAELSFAVEKKRLEFEQREMDAIQKSDLKEMDVEFDLVVLHKPLQVNNPGKMNLRLPGIRKSQPHSQADESLPPVPLPRQQNVNVEPASTQLDTSEYSLRKNVAALAATKSQLWVREEEEIIGDGDSTDELSDSDECR
ncbi:Hypothetical protein NTJ_04236 [Nesidiocoris tenuis]|uniref:Vezatin n=1 Tax=Nesidiocoris tenuis TaxID=355587 RepID=A0ABN7AHA8_9HEMI|nr:Hypothetical protein NTJ_04236 [Nesidiocoris tenuis]